MENIEYTIQYDIDLVKQFRELLDSDSIVALHIIESNEIVSFVAEHVENGQTFYSHWISSSQNWPLAYLDLVVENHFSSSKRPFRLIPFYEIDDSEWEAWVAANPKFRASQYDNFIQIDNDGDQSRSGYTRYASNTESTQQKSQSGAESKTAGSFGSRSAQSEAESIPLTPELRQAKQDLEEMKRNGVFSESNWEKNTRSNKDLMDKLNVKFEDFDKMYDKGETLSKDFLPIPHIDANGPPSIRELIAEVIIENNQMLEIQLKDKKNISEHIDRECSNVNLTLDMQTKMERVTTNFPSAIDEYKKSIETIENKLKTENDNLVAASNTINNIIKIANNKLVEIQKCIKELSEIINFCKQRNTQTTRSKGNWSLSGTIASIGTAIKGVFTWFWNFLDSFFPWLTGIIKTFWGWIREGGWGRIICVITFASIFYIGFATLSMGVLEKSYLLDPSNIFRIGSSIVCELIFGLGIPVLTTLVVTLWSSLGTWVQGTLIGLGTSGGIRLAINGGLYENIIKLADLGMERWKQLVGLIFSYAIVMSIKGFCQGYRIVKGGDGSALSDPSLGYYPFASLISDISNPAFDSGIKMIGDHPSLIPLTYIIKAIKIATVGK